MSRYEAINRLLSKTKSRLTVAKTAGEESVSVGALTPRCLGIRMSKHNPQRKRDFGSRAFETADLWQCGNVGAMLPTLTEGVVA